MAGRTPRLALAALVLASAGVALVLVLSLHQTSGETNSAQNDLHLSPARIGLHVSGNRLVDGDGRTIHLHGVNRSGTEYACIQGWGIFDDSAPANVTSQTNAEVAAIARWHVNIVRVPLNEDCWLGINGVKPQYGGATYRRAIVKYVNQLHAHGMYAELSLIWAAPGAAKATFQDNAPDEDHSPAFWASLARTFRSDPNVILAPWGETEVGWSCFLHGCSNQATYGSNQDGLGPCSPGSKTCYFMRSAGMQQAVNVMRAAGYRGPIAIPCIDFANMCGRLPDGTNYNGSTWLRSKPRDPAHQLIAEAHVYGKDACDTTKCFNSAMLPILRAGYPIIWGETGESYDASDCGAKRIASILPWADAHGVGYEAWAWDKSSGCLALITGDHGQAHSGYGRWIRSYYTKHAVPSLPSRSGS